MSRCELSVGWPHSPGLEAQRNDLGAGYSRSELTGLAIS